MFDFLKKTPTDSFAALLQVDFHSHLIPGIDDGVPDMETSLHFLKTLNEMGYKKIITTPHVMSDLYPNSSSIIKSGLELVRKELKAQKIELIVEAAAEYYLDAYFEKLLAADDILSFGDKKYILVEFSFVAPIPNFKDILFKIQTKGYTPILAHPERYNYWLNNAKVISHLRDMGLLMQVNIPSILGYYGKPTKSWALKLIKSGYIDFLGTDLHHEKHLNLFQNEKYNREFNKLIKTSHFKNETLVGQKK